MTRAFRLVAAALALTGARAAPDPAVAFRTAVEAEWDRTIEVPVSRQRGTMVLNGLWQFRPGAATRAGGWLRVPGTWAWADWPRWNLEGPLLASGTPWERQDWRSVREGHYERRVTVPAAWKGRSILLRVRRPSARASVAVDGREAGRIEWPGGDLDVTERIRPGVPALLRISVEASSTSADLEARGLAGDVELVSRPAGARLAGVFIRTSVRRKLLQLDVELEGVSAAGKARIRAEVWNPGPPVKGKPAPVRVFTADVELAASAGQTVRLEWPWADPVLWDAGKPFLYTLRVGVEGAGLRDEVAERFGFREFRIDGKGFLLNERPIRLRPYMWGDEAAVAGIGECIGRVCDGLLSTGYNLLEIWPDDTAKPGAVHFNEAWAGAADERGLLLMYPALSIDSFIDGDSAPDSAWAAWEEAMIRDWKTFRNHPSVVILAATANRFGYTDDLDPLRIGNSKTLSADFTKGGERTGKRMIDAIRGRDSTRPITSHEGGPVGDLQAANCYLDLIPLQEREEWLSAWAKDGNEPFMAVEFGTPLSCTFQRGRCQYGENRVSEPLMTEFCAIYLGSEAFRLETQDYRAMIARKFRHGQAYDWITGGADEFNNHPAHQKLQALFDASTWRSWRGWGVTGGMIPWEWGHAVRWPPGTMEVPPIPAGSTGSWIPRIGKPYCLGFSPGGMEPTEAGVALREVSRQALAWLAGPPEDWISKDHLFRAGETVHKSLAMANDGPGPAPVEASWIADLEVGRFAWGRKGESVGAAQTLFLPIEFTVPAALPGPSSGTLLVEGRSGTDVFRHVFPIRAFPPVAKPEGGPAVSILDPEGATKSWVEKLGWRTAKWDGSAVPGRILVVGRHALDLGGRLPGSVRAFAEAGGRVLLMAQDPGWLRDVAGFRVARHVSRRVFPVPSAASSTLLAGIDAETLRDWRGSGSLVPETADVALDHREQGSPPYGWHWGNRGSVTSAAIEKPHRSGWTPLLEAEFDLAYTPLMELAAGRGVAVWCTLDLEGRIGSDPAAELVAARLLEYLRGFAARPRAAQTVYLGGKRGEELLRGWGLKFATRIREGEAPGVLVVAADSGLTRADLETRLSAGWRMLLLPQPGLSLPFGFRTAGATAFAGSLDVPEWEECRGLSASDLRLRAPIATPVLVDGPEVGAGGLLGRVRSRTGCAILVQLTPDMLNADELTYFRYTSWRLTRAICQILANLGGEFEADGPSLEWAPREAVDPVPLAGTWLARIEYSRSQAAALDPSFRDPGNRGFRLGWAAPGPTATGWTAESIPAFWEKWGGPWEMDGAAWFRRTVNVPAPWIGQDLVLELGPVDDFDVTYWNGKEVGATGPGTPNHWAQPRAYRIPGRLVKPGDNTIAVRIFDQWGGGGFGGEPGSVRLVRAQRAGPDFYVPGFRTDFPLGDDPYRYYRW